MRTHLSDIVRVVEDAKNDTRNDDHSIYQHTIFGYTHQTLWERHPLHAATIFDRPQVLDKLVEAKLNVNSKTHNNDRPLHLARSSECAGILIRAGAKINVCNRQKETPLHLAHTSGIVSVFLAAGADPVARDIQNNTPLHEIRDPEACSLLIRHLQATGNGQGLIMTNDTGQTPLHHAAAKGNTVCVSKLLETGQVDVNCQDAMGCTPLHHCNNIEIMKMLLAFGGDPNMQDSNGNTPLHHCENIEIMKMLLAWGGDPNIQDSNGNTPLHHIQNSGYAIVLVTAGARLNIKNDDDMTPLDFVSSVVYGYLTETRMVYCQKQSLRTLCISDARQSAHIVNVAALPLHISHEIYDNRGTCGIQTKPGPTTNDGAGPTSHHRNNQDE